MSMHKEAILQMKKSEIAQEENEHMSDENVRLLDKAPDADGIVSYTIPKGNGTDINVDVDAVHNNLVGDDHDKRSEESCLGVIKRRNKNWTQTRTFVFVVFSTACCVLILVMIAFNDRSPIAADNHREAYTTAATVTTAATTTAATTTVQTRLGPVHGACAAVGVARGTTTATCRWRNIPFSEPIHTRFGRSSPRYSSYGDDGVGSGTQNGPACFQFVDPIVSGIDVGPHQAEDCLNLNIFAPAAASINIINNNKNNYDHDNATASPFSISSETQQSSSLLPVMVFVHGGGFLVGSAGQSAGSLAEKNGHDNKNNNNTGLTYDGARLASHGVVVVVIQYRLGIFGFLQQRDGTGGANGIGDQITALEWINEHIAAFGGDSTSVTIFGESAGSVSVSLLSHLPQAQGLFQRVIPESGVCYPSGDVLMNATEAKQARREFLNKTGITEEDLLTMDAAELRDQTVRAFDPASEFMPLFVSGVGQPSVDGDIYPDVATKLEPLPVDLLHGYNSGEMKVWGGSFSFLTKYLGGAVVKSIIEQYGPHPNEADVLADACLRCQSIRYAQRVANRNNINNSSRVYFYVYDNPRNNSMHGAELPAVFGTAGGAISMEGSTLKTSEALVRRTQRIWTDFARGRGRGDNTVSDTTLPDSWPQVLAGGTSIRAMLIGEEETSVIEISTSQCNAWRAAEDTVGGFATARMCNAAFA